MRLVSLIQGMSRFVLVPASTWLYVLVRLFVEEGAGFQFFVILALAAAEMHYFQS